MLVNNGWTGAIDGGYGPLTKARTVVWQGDPEICDLPAGDQDGIVGSQTWNCSQFADSIYGDRLVLINAYTYGGISFYIYQYYGGFGTLDLYWRNSGPSAWKYKNPVTGGWVYA